MFIVFCWVGEVWVREEVREEDNVLVFKCWLRGILLVLKGNGIFFFGIRFFGMFLLGG